MAPAAKTSESDTKAKVTPVAPSSPKVVEKQLAPKQAPSKVVSSTEQKKPVASSVKAALVSAKYNPFSSNSDSKGLNPPLKDVSSDKKFFGPPFPADYPEDNRPVADKGILSKLKGPGQPYPALQSKADFDKDYVKDENSDTGSWKAQFEYDALRRKLAQEKAEANRAEGRAGKEKADADSAEAEAERARKEYEDAKKVADETVGEEGNAGKDGTDDAAPSAEALEKLKKQLDEAEANYEKEKKEFEECKRQLEEAKANIEGLKAKQVEMEQQLASETKLYEERKTVKLNLKKVQTDAASAKRAAAQEKLAAAKKNKAELDEVLATKRHRSDLAKENAKKANAKLEAFKKDLEKATLNLQRIRGYKSGVASAPVKSEAKAAYSAIVLPLLALVAMRIM
jgi:hypothetical protein